MTVILCVGSNYAHHVQEMGGAIPAEPKWFLKPETAICHDGDPVRIPADVGAVHHEVELAVRLGDDGSPDRFTVAVDVTARTLQAEAKKAGAPWSKAKGFDTFLPLGKWVPADGVDLQDLRLALRIDGETRQEGWTGDMTWDIPQLLQEAARWITLRPGDILLTGTPEGVGPIAPGQAMEAEVVGHVRLRNPIVGR